MSKESAHSATNTMAMLDNARRMHTAAAVRQQQLTSKKGGGGGKQNELVAGVLEEIGALERMIEMLQADESKEMECELVTQRSKALQSLSEHLEMTLRQRIDMTEFYATLRRQVIELSGLSLFREKKLPSHFVGDASDLNALDLASGPFLSLQCCDHLSSGRLRVLLQEGPTILGREHQMPNVFICSQFVEDFHCACHNTSGNLELELLRENAEVYISGRLISNSNDLGMDGSSAGGVDMMALEESEEEEEGREIGITLESNGLPRLHHDDWVALTPCSAFMFQVVYHEEVADKLRSGNLNPLNRSRPSSVLEWNAEAFRLEAIEMLDSVPQNDNGFEEDIHPAAMAALSLMGNHGKKMRSEASIFEAARLLSTVAECNLMATYMVRDNMLLVCVMINWHLFLSYSLSICM
jgi:hypothetical protein